MTVFLFMGLEINSSTFQDSRVHAILLEQKRAWRPLRQPGDRPLPRVREDSWHAAIRVEDLPAEGTTRHAVASPPGKRRRPEDPAQLELGTVKARLRTAREVEGQQICRAGIHPESDDEQGEPGQRHGDGWWGRGLPVLASRGRVSGAR